VTDGAPLRLTRGCAAQPRLKRMYGHDRGRQVEVPTLAAAHRGKIRLCLSGLRWRACPCTAARRRPLNLTKGRWLPSLKLTDGHDRGRQGSCQTCRSAHRLTRDAPAPFLRTDGTPYLEPHHLRRVSDGGPDHPAHVIALCPNCHRRVHGGADGQTYNTTLIAMMLTLEPEAAL
jgi:HNH endonuclease